MNLEADFALDELFFSKTDFKGTIKAGNRVFIRVSEFEQSEILDRPHNIIRHKDMPKTVFRLFWSYLKQNKPIAAYVKNRSKSGKYYWVFAMAFPMQDGYLSVRLKPTSPYFDHTQKIYQSLLSLEAEGLDLDEGIQILSRTLKDLGFQSYEEFMTTALKAELKSRDAGLGLESRQLETTHPTLLRELQQASAICTQAARAAFLTADLLDERTTHLRSHSLDLHELCREVQMVTTNLTITAAKLGESGKPLTVVSKNLERLASEILESSRAFEALFRSFAVASQNMTFAMGASRFQIEMMNHLIEETLKSPDLSETVDDENRQFLTQNCKLLKELITINFKQAEEIAQKLIRENKSLIRSVGMLSKVTAGMDVICVVGKIEMARVRELSTSLEALLGDMEVLTEKFKVSLRLIENEIQWGMNKSTDLKEQLSFIAQNLNKIDRTLIA